MALEVILYVDNDSIDRQTYPPFLCQVRDAARQAQAASRGAEDPWAEEPTASSVSSCRQKVKLRSREGSAPGTPATSAIPAHIFDTALAYRLPGHDVKPLLPCPPKASLAPRKRRARFRAESPPTQI